MRILDDLVVTGEPLIVASHQQIAVDDPLESTQGMGHKQKLVLSAAPALPTFHTLEGRYFLSIVNV